MQSNMRAMSFSTSLQSSAWLQMQIMWNNKSPSSCEDLCIRSSCSVLFPSALTESVWDLLHPELHRCSMCASSLLHDTEKNIIYLHTRTRGKQNLSIWQIVVTILVIYHRKLSSLSTTICGFPKCLCDFRFPFCMLGLGYKAPLIWSCDDGIYVFYGFS